MPSNRPKKIIKPINPAKSKKTIDIIMSLSSDSESETNSISNVGIFKCEYCDNSFAHKNNLYRHQKHRCFNKLEIDKKQKQNNKSKTIKMQLADALERIDKQDKELQRLRKELEKQTKTLILDLKEQNKSLYETQKLSSTTLDKSVDAITYLSKYRKRAPNLQQLTHETAKDLLTCEPRLYDYLLHHNDEGTLYQYIGDIILKYIKKEDPDEQSVWNSDVSRLTYLIRDLVNDEETWQRDVEGVLFTKYVITPIIEYLTSYLTNCLQPEKKQPHESDQSKSSDDSDSSDESDSSNDSDSSDVSSKSNDSDKSDGSKKSNNSAECHRILLRTSEILGTKRTIRSKKFKKNLLLYIGARVCLKKQDPVKSNSKRPVKSNSKQPVKSNSKHPVKSIDKHPTETNVKYNDDNKDMSRSHKKSDKHAQ